MASMTAYGEITISDLQDSYTISLTPDHFQISTDYDRKITSSSSVMVNVQVIHGTDNVADFTIGDIKETVSGLTYEYDRTNKQIIIKYLENSIVGRDNGVLTLPITVDSVTFDRTISWSCSKSGQKGDSGSSLTKVDTEIRYAIGNSATSHDGLVFNSTTPVKTTIENPYLWTQTKIISYIDGIAQTPVYSYSVSSSIDGINIGGRNLFSVNDFDRYNATFNKDGYKFNLTNTNTHAGAVIKLNEHMQIESNYCLSFKISSLNDIKLTNIRFRPARKSSYISMTNLICSIFIDDIEIQPGVSDIVTFPDNIKDFDVHYILIKFKASNELLSYKDINLHLLFNYSSNNGLEYSIWDIMLEEATVPSAWTPSYNDSLSDMQNSLNIGGRNLLSMNMLRDFNANLIRDNYKVNLNNVHDYAALVIDLYESMPIYSDYCLSFKYSSENETPISNFRFRPTEISTNADVPISKFQLVISIDGINLSHDAWGIMTLPEEIANNGTHNVLIKFKAKDTLLTYKNISFYLQFNYSANAGLNYSLWDIMLEESNIPSAWTPAYEDLESALINYTHIRYSENSDGSNFVEIPTINTKYIGIYTGPSATAPIDKSSYTWNKFIGDDGVSVVDHEVEYGVGSSNTSYSDVTEWIKYSEELNNIPSATNEKPRLWKRSRYKYSNGNYTDWIYENSFSETTVKHLVDEGTKTITDIIGETSFYTKVENGQVVTETIKDKLTEAKANLEGFEQTVSNTYAAKEDFATQGLTFEQTVSKFRQTSDTIDLMVSRTDSSGTSESKIELTENFINMISEGINLSGYVTFSKVSESLANLGIRNHIPSSRSLNSIRDDMLTFGNANSAIVGNTIAY